MAGLVAGSTAYSVVPRELPSQDVKMLERIASEGTEKSAGQTGYEIPNEIKYE